MMCEMMCEIVCEVMCEIVCQTVRTHSCVSACHVARARTHTRTRSIPKTNTLVLAPRSVRSARHRQPNLPLPDFDSFAVCGSPDNTHFILHLDVRDSLHYIWAHNPRARTHAIAFARILAPTHCTQTLARLHSATDAARSHTSIS